MDEVQQVEYLSRDCDYGVLLELFSVVFAWDDVDGLHVNGVCKL